MLFVEIKNFHALRFVWILCLGSSSEHRRLIEPARTGDCTANLL